MAAKLGLPTLLGPAGRARDAAMEWLANQQDAIEARLCPAPGRRGG